jgi:hypothetical protein
LSKPLLKMIALPNTATILIWALFSRGNDTNPAVSVKRQPMQKHLLVSFDVSISYAVVMYLLRTIASSISMLPALYRVSHY